MTKAIALLGCIVAAALLSLGAPSQGTATGPNCSAEQGQEFIDEGNYTHAISEFSCLIDAEPTGVEGYRGRIEAQLLLGRFSDAVRDYARVTAFVEPVHPDAKLIIYAGYADRLAVAPNNVPALTGASFARWYFFDYPQAIHMLDHLLEVKPGDLYGILFRGSNRLLKNVNKTRGIADLEQAISMAPTSPDVRYVVADAYTYGQPHDPARALAEASLALDGGLDTPRVHASLGAAYTALGDPDAAALEVQQHLELVTTNLVATSPLAARETRTLDVVPGLTYEIPLNVTAGETISISTSSHEFVDTIALLLAPDGSPVLGSDDTPTGYFAAFDHVAQETGTYLVHVTSFESVSTGALTVTRR
jgi:tetratricopeptide (TPR) repeat protein